VTKVTNVTARLPRKDHTHIIITHETVRSSTLTFTRLMSEPDAVGYYVLERLAHAVREGPGPLSVHCYECDVVVAGFEGKKCEKLSSVSLRESDAYVSLPPLSHRPHSNVTLLLSTREKQGVILYHGVDEHLAVELFLGRLRVSYNIGNYPVSTMFSYEQLSDGSLFICRLTCRFIEAVTRSR